MILGTPALPSSAVSLFYIISSYFTHPCLTSLSFHSPVNCLLFYLFFPAFFKCFSQKPAMPPYNFSDKFSPNPRKTDIMIPQAPTPSMKIPPHTTTACVVNLHKQKNRGSDPIDQILQFNNPMSMVYHFPRQLIQRYARRTIAPARTASRNMNSSFPIPILHFPYFPFPHDIPGFSGRSPESTFQKDFLPAFLSNGYPNMRYCQCFPTDRSLPFSRFTRFTCKSVPLTISIPCSVSSNISFRLKRQDIQNTCHQSCFPVIQYQFMVFLCCWSPKLSQPFLLII